MKKLFHETGNSVLMIMVFAAVGMIAVVYVMQYAGVANRISIQAVQRNEFNSQDISGLGFLVEKFQLKGVEQVSTPEGNRARFLASGTLDVPPSGDQHPFIFVEPYPSPEELINPNFKPKVNLFRYAPENGQPSPNLKTDTAPVRPVSIPLMMVEGKINRATGRCELLPNPRKSFVNVPKAADDCKVSYYSLDTSKLFSIEGQTRSSEQTGAYQRGFIGFPNLNVLSSDQSGQFFNQSNFALPKEAIDSRLVEFLRIIPDTQNPRVLKALDVRVGDTVARVPMDLPPEPEVVIELAPGTSEPLAPGQLVNVVIKTNSITVSGSISDNNYLTSSSGRPLAFGRQSARNIQSASFTTQVTVPMRVPRDLYTNGYYGGPRINPANDREGFWTIGAKVQGLSNTTHVASKNFRINPPPKPDCSLGFASDRYREGVKELLQGENLTINIDCNTPRSGHVDFIQIGGIPVSNFDNNPASANYKKGSVVYSRRNLVSAETMAASASGPGGTWNGAEYLNATCAFNDPYYKGPLGTIFGSWPFSRNLQFDGSYEFVPTGESATGYSMSTVQAHTAVQEYQQVTCWNTCYKEDGTAYACNAYECGYWYWIDPWTYEWIVPGGLDRASRQRSLGEIRGSHYAITLFGLGIYAEVGHKRDASCAIRSFKARTGGCFTADTKILMADGKEKKVSEIAETESILNPLYNVPVKVSKIVKGPEKKPLYEVKVSKDKLVVTEDHPFLTQRGWLRTDELKISDLLLGDGAPKKIDQVRKMAYKKPVEVYNFELESDVAEGHIVRANGIPTGDLKTQNSLKEKKHELP